MPRRLETWVSLCNLMLKLCGISRSSAIRGGGFKETKMFLPHPLVKLSIAGSLRDREVACWASDLQGLNFESYVWRAVSSHSSHHPQEVLLAQFSLYVHRSGLKPDSLHFILGSRSILVTTMLNFSGNVNTSIQDPYLILQEAENVK